MRSLVVLVGDRCAVGVPAGRAPRRHRRGNTAVGDSATRAVGPGTVPCRMELLGAVRSEATKISVRLRTGFLSSASAEAGA